MAVLALLATLPIRADSPRETPGRLEPQIAATVGGEPIYVRQVDRLLEAWRKDREVAADALASHQARALAVLVDRQLVLSYLRRTKQGASPAEIDAALARFQSRLKRQSLTLEKYLATTEISDGELRQRIAWELGWAKYLDRELTDKKLAAWFDEHRGDFDGRQVRVRHILLPAPVPGSQADWQSLEEKAAALREQIVRGQLGFDAAAAKYSAGATARQGGDLGFIPRHGEMTEVFAAAAFSLKPQEISPPVRSRYGVHLIQCLEIRAGKQTWTDVQTALRQAMAKELFRELAAAELERTTVIYRMDPAKNDPGGPNDARDK